MSFHFLQLKMVENIDVNTECTFVQTWNIGIWSLKTVLIPSINTVYCSRRLMGSMTEWTTPTRSVGGPG